MFSFEMQDLKNSEFFLLFFLFFFGGGRGAGGWLGVGGGGVIQNASGENYPDFLK